MGDANSSNFRDKDPSVLPTDDGDAQRLRTFVHNDIAGFLQVRPGGKEKAFKMNSIQEKRLQDTRQDQVERVWWWTDQLIYSSGELVATQAFVSKSYLVRIMKIINSKKKLSPSPGL